MDDVFESLFSQYRRPKRTPIKLSPLFQCDEFHFTFEFKICGFGISTIIGLNYSVKEGLNRLDFLMKLEMFLMFSTHENMAA